jgi:hypothetical protein
MVAVHVDADVADRLASSDPPTHVDTLDDGTYAHEDT